jgi:DNA-binding HxlR family transcriptional regulator
MADLRSYDDACGAAHALELIGERWALLVLRELMLGPRRFGELRADLPGISANVLTQRLAELEARGLAARRQLPPPASVQVYEATPWGLEAEAITQALGRWAARSPRHDPTAPISPVSVLLSFRAMLARERVGDLDIGVGFRFGDYAYRGRLNGDGFVIERGEAAAPDLSFAGDARALAGAVYGGVPIEAQGDALTVAGDPALVARFLTLFPLPPKVATRPPC